MSAADRRDAIIVGGGHQWLVAACYLARAGLLRARARAAVSGGRRLRHRGDLPRLQGLDRRLREQPLPQGDRARPAPRPARLRGAAAQPFVVHAATRTGARSCSGRIPRSTEREIAKFSARDAARYPEYEAMLERVAALRRADDHHDARRICCGPASRGLLAPARARAVIPPARVGGVGGGRGADRRRRDRFSTAGSSRPSSSPRWPPTPSSARWRAPSMPGTAYVLFHHVMGETDGRRGVWGYVRGGMGGLTQALARAARGLGVEIRCEAEVARDPRPGRPRRRGGASPTARSFARPSWSSNADAHVTFTRLARGARAARRVPGRGRADQLRERLAEDQRRARRAAGAFAPARAPSPGPSTGARSTSVPTSTTSSARSTTPSTAGPPRARCSSAPFPRWWTTRWRRRAGTSCRSSCSTRRMRSARATGISSASRSPTGASRCSTSTRPTSAARCSRRQVLTPLDIERTFNLTGGNIFQGAMTPSQLFSFRPVPGHADYRTPVRGLYLCGAATHPGGGVSGRPRLQLRPASPARPPPALGAALAGDDDVVDRTRDASRKTSSRERERRRSEPGDRRFGDGAATQRARVHDREEEHPGLHGARCPSTTVTP